MSELVVQTFLSLDGVMQAPGAADDDREGGFDRGGWLVRHFDDAMWQKVVDLHARAGGLLLGRKTYETMASYFPGLSDDENPAASTMNRLPKYVASRTLESVEWSNSTRLEGDVATAVAELKDAPGAEIQVLGSGDLAQTLMRHDLVDRYRLWFFPVLVGGGKRLFAGGTIPTTLELIETETSETGVAMHTYERVGALEVR
jgi:dihydrofolate reductase